ncbi:MAG: isochorismatase family protein [Solirubrobacterales bacterium]
MSAAAAIKATTEGEIAVAGSRPYPWPYDGELTTASFALVVVSGPATGREGDERSREMALTAASKLAGPLRELGAAVIWISCGGGSLPKTAPGDMVIEAPTANAFLGGNLDLVLRTNGIEKLAFAGWPTEIAVHSTLRRANDLGFECLFLEDACVAYDPELQKASISQILMSGGIFGAVGTSDALIEACYFVNSTTTASAVSQKGETE